ncbi:MAG TPA: hypothetical protein VMT75_12645 [Candidatus Saccharimonadales bacterium]|nr:hypothetical protein [Candidatus Saccharimonadales bacterium]
MAGIGQILYRTFFWSYERGTWQYDVAVVLIVVFVLATPPRWFHDQPQVVLPANATLVEQISSADGTEIYRVDARVLAPPERTPALSNDLHTALQKSRKDLNDGGFSIRKIEAIRDEKGNVIAYQVEIRH